MKSPVLVVLGLGSNAGDSSAILDGAVKALAAVLDGLRQAPVYRTPPWGVTDQPDFLNTAVSGLFGDTPEALLAKTGGIEAAFGRNRAKERRWGPRTLDIDILLFGDSILNTPALVIPHPRLCERAFALRPLLDLLPDARDPLTGRPYSEALDRLPDKELLR